MVDLEVGKTYKRVVLDMPDDVIEFEGVTVLDRITPEDGSPEYVLLIAPIVTVAEAVLEVEEMGTT